MAVSIGELLGAVRAHVDAVADPDAGQALAVVAGLASIGRALELLYGYRPQLPITDEARQPEAAALAQACLETGRCWPDAAGRVADLLGATADAIGSSARSFTGEQRWALTEALAEIARRCADTAQRFEPYSDVPQLADVRAAAVTCEYRAARLPATAADRTALDHLVAARHVAADPDEQIVDAAAALHRAIAMRGRGGLEVAEMVLTLNAGQLATAHAAAALHEATDRDAAGLPHELAGLAAPDAWRAARAYCASLDDGSKLRPRENSPIASAAARLGRAMLEHLGPATTSTTGQRAVEPDIVSALQTVTGLLPDIAIGLDRATRIWISNRPVWAPERRLLSYEGRNEAVTSTDHAVRARYIDLKPLSETLRNAVDLTTALSSELADHVQRRPRLPHLNESHATATNANQDLPVQAQSARREASRAQALHPSDWALPIQPRTLDPLQRARAAVDRATDRLDQREQQTGAQPREGSTRQHYRDRHADRGLEAGR